MSDKPRLTANMLKILRDIHEGRGTGWNCHGQSQHGARASTLTALARRGLIDRDHDITAAGIETLAAHWQRGSIIRNPNLP